MNYIVEVEAEVLKSIIKKADKVCGTLEPSMRKLVFLSEDERLYIIASDGCLNGYFPVVPFYSKIASPFEIPLDVVKHFVSELSGKISLHFQDGVLSLKSQNETLRLRIAPFQKDREEKVFVPKHTEGAVFSKRKLLSELDFASSFLEEGSYVDLYFSRNALEVISQHYGLVAYSRLDVERNMENPESVSELNIGSFSIRIPYVSARHLIKVLEIEETNQVHFSFDPIKNKVVIFSGDMFTMCADIPEETPHMLRNLCIRFEPKIRILSSLLQRLLRRSLIAGRFSDVEIYSRHGEIVVVSQHGSIAYRGSIPIEGESEEIRFSFQTKAFMLRSVLNRIGSQYVLIDNVNEYVLLAPPSLSRFLVVRNKGI
uniref:DNA polymerase III subunit beta n=1 Tax=Fervidobacterium pennivorans TaxID=93466 RepID=A0A7V4KEK3_FERPE